eukprot:TRINITY_DN50406_c0_g1_i1.p1 TRINITY_DN50406_c0_g1~~TRINITY_DN50406_c0_g1_i1.p1  ORF type:complete len:570 (-),score=112.73 TRINITY_DN50406_c0_g1_i1:26-1735(-)
MPAKSMRFARLSPFAARPATLLACVLLLLTVHTEGALTIGSRDADDLITKLRQSIFIDTSYLEVRPAKSTCSTLDGPGCFKALLGASADEGSEERPASSLAALDGPGVIPESLLHDLGVSGPGPEFITPEYDVLESLRRQQETWLHITGSPKMLEGTQAQNFLTTARRTAEAGVLSFKGTEPDHRMPLTFSSGLPSGLVATWDGRWIARDCSLGSSNASALVPAVVTGLSGLTADAGRLKAYSKDVSPQLSSSVELASSLGYLRFSHPVSVRSLFVRWQPDSDSATALIGGRLGLDSVWSSHLHPGIFQSSDGWVDVTGGPLDLVDELVFFVAPGLQIGAMEVVTASASAENIATLEKEGDASSSVFMLRPQAALADAQNAENVPRFVLQLQDLNQASAPYIASLQEVVDLNLQLRDAPLPQVLGLAKGQQMNGLLSWAALPAILSNANPTFVKAAAANQDLFEHKNLEGMTVAGSAAAKALASLHRTAIGVLPGDLHRQVVEAGPSLAGAVHRYVKQGGWQRGTPTTLPQNGTEEALKMYISAKETQAKLDLLTAVLLHLSPQAADDS